MKRLVLLLLLAAGTAADAQEQSRAMPSVETFIRARSFHGMQYEAAARYGPEAVPALVKVLGDPEARDVWAPAVWVLGIVATPEGTEALIAFHERGVEGVADQPALQALLLVPQALGFAANDPESRAFAYLAETIDPDDREMAWTGPDWEPGSQEVLIAKLAANGLGLAGNEAGRRVLEETRARLTETSPERLRFLRSNIAEALATSRRIEELGYARALAQPQRDPRVRPRSPSDDDSN